MSADRSNNFDLLRLFAASLVFISHSFPIYGLHEPELLPGGIYGKQITPGTLGVSIFFVISGYLVSASYQRMGEPFKFLKNRALRIYPGFIANAVLTTCVLMPLVSTQAGYFGRLLENDVMTTIGLLLIMFTMPVVEGVFGENPVRHVTNGSLRTLRFEVSCYLVLAAVGAIFGLTKRNVLIILTVFLLFFYSRAFFPQDDGDLGYLHCLEFILGAGMYLWKDRIRMRSSYALIALVSLVLVFCAGLYLLPLYSLLVAYIVIYLAAGTGSFLNFAKYGDFSYGIYIYAWPVQQTVAMLYKFEPADYTYFLATSFVITFFVAIISWHLVEQPSLKLKS